MLSAACGAGKQRAHAARDAFLDREHRCAVARSPQPRQIGLGEALVLAGERRRETDILDRAIAVQVGEGQRRLPIGNAAGIDGCRCHRIKRRCLAGTDIPDPRALGVVEKMEIHLDHVLDTHEIAALLARAVTARTLE